VRIPRTGTPSVSPDGQWLFWVDAGVPDLIMATAVDSGKTVKIRPSVGAVDSPVAAVNDGRTRVGFLAGAPGGVGVYVADVTDALERLRAEGVTLIDETPRAGSRGTTIAFVHPRSMGGVLVELVQEPPVQPT